MKVEPVVDSGGEEEGGRERDRVRERMKPRNEVEKREKKNYSGRKEPKMEGGRREEDIIVRIEPMKVRKDYKKGGNVSMKVNKKDYIIKTRIKPKHGVHDEECMDVKKYYKKA